jgi:hypothetical protein
MIYAHENNGRVTADHVPLLMLQVVNVPGRDGTGFPRSAINYLFIKLGCTLLQLSI